MWKKNQRPVKDRNGESKAEHKFIGLITRLIRSDLDGLGRALLKILGIKWHDRPIETEATQQGVTPLPTGPFKTTRRRHLGDLLLWVPTKIDSYFVDDLTGGYGYSHTTIDTGEVDLPTRRPVMAEVTVGETVTRKFQDQFGRRPFARVPLSKTGVDVKKFVECVISKMGDQYDGWEAITLGRIEDPSKQVCSGLAADCLPEKERKRIAWARRLGLLHRRSVSVYSRPDAIKTREFVSPNGFAEYYGVPKGKELTRPNVKVRPHPVEFTVENVAYSATRHHGWKLALVACAAVFVIYFLRRNGSFIVDRI